MFYNSRFKQQLVYTMAIMFFLCMAATDIYLPSLPSMVTEFHTTPNNINLTLSSFTIALAISVLFIGDISNRYGRKITLTGGLFVFSCASWLIAITHSLPVIIFLRVIQAIGTSSITIVTRLILRDCMDDKEQIHANAILLSGFIVSPAVAPVIGAHLAHLYGWRSSFIFIGIISLILAVIACLTLPETNLTPINKFPSITSTLKSYVTILFNKVFLTLSLIYVCGVGAFFAFIGISSYLFIREWHLSATSFSYIFLAMSVGYLLGNFTLRFLIHLDVTIYRIIGYSCYSALIGLLVIYLSMVFINYNNHYLSTLLIILGALLMRAANALVNSPVQVKLMRYFHTQSAKAAGLNMCLAYGFNGVATYLVTVLFPSNPFKSLVVVSTIFTLLSIILYLCNRNLIRTNTN